MTYYEQQPAKLLSKYIDKFWYCRTDDLTGTFLTIPFLHHELVFNFSDHYEVHDHQSKKTLIKNETSWINGIQTRPYITNSSGKHEMAGVLFKPNGLIAFTGFHAGEFKNNFFNASLIFTGHFRTLIDQMQNAITPSAKIALIEKFLIKKLFEQNSPQYVENAIQIFSQPSFEKPQVSEICRKLRISNKSLINSFDKFIGIGPAKYQMLQHINQALLKLAKDPDQSLTDLAYKLNFYDQAHFTNFFRNITTFSPSQYASLHRNKKADSDSLNFISLAG